jgi:membrane protein
MMPSVKRILGTVKDAGNGFMEDNAMQMAAAISYYTVFSLPPLLILILMLVGIFLDPVTVREMIQGEFAGMVGPDGAETIGTMIESARDPAAGGTLATILGMGALLFGATGAFIALQQALNRTWEVAPDPNAGGIKAFVTKRLFSFGMILAVAFLLLVSLALTAALQAFGHMLGGLLPGGGEAILAQVLSLIVSFAVISLLFAAIFKVLPDASIEWRDVWVGAIATALLFTVGKFLIGLYLGRSDPGDAFGAAGSLAVLLVWIYYSALILLFGAEFTKVWADRFGSGIEPERGAIRMVSRTEPAPPPVPETKKA